MIDQCQYISSVETAGIALRLGRPRPPVQRDDLGTLRVGVRESGQIERQRRAVEQPGAHREHCRIEERLQFGLAVDIEENDLMALGREAAE